MRRLDELAQRMNKTRSDVIRDLINRFDEALKQEVEKERRKWMAIGIVSALESAILDPELMLRFVRRNVDILGYLDFIIGMVRVRNRVVLFSHHDRIGNQLLQLVMAKLEEDVRREEVEIEREEENDEEVGVGKATPVRIRVSGAARPNTIRVALVPSKYKLLINNKATPPIARPTAATAVGKPVVSNGEGAAKAAVAAAVPENQKLAAAPPISTNPANSQTKDSGPQASAGGGGMDLVRPADQGLMGSPRGDFVFALIANSYHKHRDKLLRLIESITGD